MLVMKLRFKLIYEVVSGKVHREILDILLASTGGELPKQVKLLRQRVTLLWLISLLRHLQMPRQLQTTRKTTFRFRSLATLILFEFCGVCIFVA